MKISLNAWNGSRIYVNDVGSPKGQPLGYFKIEETETRRGNSYYDRHRTAKGDCVVIDSCIEWCGPEGLAARVLDAVFGAETILYTSLGLDNTKHNYTWRTLRIYSQDELARLMVAKCATGVSLIAYNKETAAQKAAKKAAREAQVFEMPA